MSPKAVWIPIFCGSVFLVAGYSAFAAAAWAVSDIEGQCSARKPFLKERPRIDDIACSRLDGWVSYYVCRALASAT